MGAKRAQALVQAQGAQVTTARTTAPWSDVGTVAGSTLSGLGQGLSAASMGGSTGATSIVSDTTPILVLGGVLALGLVVWALKK